MDELPDHVISDILRRILKIADRNSVSLTCRRFNELDNEHRKCIRIGCGLNPVHDGLTSLCKRFSYLEKIEINYLGWMSRLGKQLGDEGLFIVSDSCPYLRDVTLSHCTFISDTGLSYLSSCSKLLALRLFFTPRITGSGILSIVTGCKSLAVLHLIRCIHVNSFEWLECVGKIEMLEDLCIRNCRLIGEGDLIKLGPTWEKLKYFQFEVDANYRYMKVYDRLQKQCIPCDNLRELTLVNCIISPGKGLACILATCRNLEKIHLDMCVGVRDCDIIGLAHQSRNLKSISIQVPSDYSVPLLTNNPLRLTDLSLHALADRCYQLESVRLSFSDGEFPSFSSFTLNGILKLIHMCPIRELSLDHVYSFDDVGMRALCSAQYLEVLELVRCQEITDDGLQLIGQFPKLRDLSLVKCLGVTDYGLAPLSKSYKLESLTVDGCPQISERGVQGAAKFVSFKNDLSWMY